MYVLSAALVGKSAAVDALACIDAVKRPCAGCGRPLWLAPSSVAAIRANPAMTALCAPCTRERVKGPMVVCLNPGGAGELAALRRSLRDIARN